MSAKYDAGQVFTVENYPFVRYMADLIDDEGCGYQAEGWRPGCSVETERGMWGAETSYVADGTGKMVLEVVSAHRPGKYQERVFYLRRWIDPDGREFGATKLRVTTAAAFTKLRRGYRHDFELEEVAA